MAEEIELKDPTENVRALSVRELASKTSDVAGDGTTIATVLAQTIRSIRGNAIDGATYENLLAELAAAPGVARLVDSATGGGQERVTPESSIAERTTVASTETPQTR